MTVREILKVLRKDGWYTTNQEGSHISLKHPTKPGKVTVPNHNGDLKPGTLNSIYKQAGAEIAPRPAVIIERSVIYAEFNLSCSF